LKERASLFGYLLSAAPTERSTRLEDFFTQGLAFLCRIEPALATGIASLYGVELSSPVVETQLWHGANRFDLVLGHLGDPECLILENKVGSDFDSSQISRYLRDTRVERPHVGCLTVYPEHYVPPPEDAPRWAGAHVWRDVCEILNSFAEKGSSQVVRYLAADLSKTLQERGAIVDKVSSSVFRPNPGRDALYHLLQHVAEDAVKRVGGNWGTQRPSFGSFYLYQGMTLSGKTCLALAFSDGRGEVALLIDKEWTGISSGRLPSSFTITSGEFFDWPARKIDTKQLDQAATFKQQAEYLTEVVLAAMQEIQTLEASPTHARPSPPTSPA
jgi:hypothetical protein